MGQGQPFTLYGEGEWGRLYEGDCLSVLPVLREHSADLLLTDPPSATSVFQRNWDGDRGGRAAWVAWLAARLGACLRVVRPGSVALVWALPRTSHWTALALEDAGWRIEDRISNLFAYRMPKTRGKLKPAIEDWWLARAPGPSRDLDVDACRIPTENTADEETYRRKCESVVGLDNPRGFACYGIWTTPRTLSYSPEGRRPSNVALTCSCLGEGHEDGCPVREIDRQSGFSRSRVGQPRASARPGENFGSTHTGTEYDDEGGASRFFPRFHAEHDARFWFTSRETTAKKSAGIPEGRRNNHPAVKPLSLCHWLLRLACPPGGLVLDPFAGTASIGVAAVDLDYRYLGIEENRDPKVDACAIAAARLGHAQSQKGGGENVTSSPPLRILCEEDSHRDETAAPATGREP